jgi:hypothetical protein
MEEEIIQVLMLNESAIQKPTKFQALGGCQYVLCSLRVLGDGDGCVLPPLPPLLLDWLEVMVRKHELRIR